MADTIYATGMYGKKPSDKAPDFVLGNISIKVDDFIPFLQAHKNDTGYVNLQLKDGKEGRMNITLDTWKPKAKSEEKPPEPSAPKSNNDDPFK